MTKTLITIESIEMSGKSMKAIATLTPKMEEKEWEVMEPLLTKMNVEELPTMSVTLDIPMNNSLFKLMEPLVENIRGIVETLYANDTVEISDE